MFFIACFGIEDKDEIIGNHNNIICPDCGRLASYEIHKSYRYLHIFFIPTFRWNVRYFVRTSCCGCLYELDPVIGREFEKNHYTEIRKENLRRINNYSPFRYCPNCKANIPAEFNYCPYCGGKL